MRLAEEKEREGREEKHLLREGTAAEREEKVQLREEMASLQ